MANRFNGGRGAITCDYCNTMTTSGNRQIMPYLTIDNGDEHPSHFCGRACLDATIVNV